MKNKLMKILGIALTLAVLVGLLLPAMPASAGVLAWTNVDMPDKFVDGTTLTAVGVSPDGKVILVFNDEDSVFLKSTDGGVSFSSKGLNDGEDAVILCCIWQIVFSPKFATDQTVIAVGDNGVILSDDAGKTWMVLEPQVVQIPLGSLDPGYVESADISYDYNDKLSVLIGYQNDVVLFTDRNSDRWVDLSTSENAFDYITGDVKAVKFSTDYADDGEILAVVDNETDGIFLQTAFIANDISETYWNDTMKTVVFDEDGGDQILDGSTWINLPSDYTSEGSTAKVFVGISNYDDASATEVYRVSMALGDIADAPKKATSLKMNVDEIVGYIASMDYKGTAASGVLAVGVENDIMINTKAATSTDAADWISDSVEGKLPTGDDPLVAFSPTSTMLYAATANYGYDGPFGSVFAASSDYKSFDGLSLINVDNVAEVTIGSWSGAGSANQLVLMKAEPSGPANNAQMIFKTTDSGKTWKEIYANYTPETDNTIMSYAWSGDNIYVVMQFTDIMKSTNGGTTFSAFGVRTIDKNILSFALAGSDYFVAGPDGEIYKNSSRTPVVLPDIGDYEIAVMIPIPGFFIVVTTDGNTFGNWGPPKNGPLYFSGDGGVTFKQLTDTEFDTETFDVPGRTIYAVKTDESASIYKYNVDTSTDWDLVCELDADPIKSISLADGVLYAVIDTVADDTVQVLRSVNLGTANIFEPVPGSCKDDLMATFQPGPLSIVTSDAGNTIYKALNLNATPEKGIGSVAKTYADTLVKGPAIIAPAANAQIPGTFTFQWGAVSAGSRLITYELQIATDDKFQGKITETTTATTRVVTDLMPGMSYFVRAKVVGYEDDFTVSSKWSATVPFIVKLDTIIEHTGWIAPAAGATGESQSPNFNWASVPGATGYELVIDGGAPIKLTDPVYTVTTPFAYGSTHTWKVRAIANGNAGDWVTGVFTVKAAPPTTPPPTTAPPKFFDPNSGQYFDTQAQLDAFQAQWKLTHTPTPAPSTPAYIWVIIVIGAILVIAVIVLIARTRRV
jgi:hypothetical protein